MDKFVCSFDHKGLERHTHKEDPNGEGVTIENVVFSRCTHIPCNDSMPIIFDATTETNQFDLFTTFKNVTFDDYNAGSNRVGFCPPLNADINDVHLTDLDGRSLTPAGTPPGTELRSDDGNRRTHCLRFSRQITL
jgi:hypothetical protein